MNCDEFYQDEGLFLDGELPPEKRDLMRAHLSSCPGCELRYISNTLLKALLNTRLARFTPDATFAEHVRTAVMNG